ncbi:MAG: cell division protein FtsA [Anaerolineae bacterium]|nr:cell division protein FtsA [Anaerolineae bacterium]
MGELVVGIDVGTTKVATVVGEVTDTGVRVVGIGVEPSRGIKKGVVNDIQAATSAIAASVRKAERSSGYEIGRAFVSVAGAHIASMNSRGVVGIGGGSRPVIEGDLERVLDAARAVTMPHNLEVLHVLPRYYVLDGQSGVRNPVGMHGFRLEVETHIVTASRASVTNLEKCVQGAGVFVDRFILNPLASGEAVLSDTERESGVVVVDIGGGTTDMAVFIEDAVWHTGVLAVGGEHITNDIAHGLRLPFDLAEAVKLQYGHADPQAIDPLASFPVQPFGEDLPSQVARSDLAMIIEARTEEIFSLVLQEIKRSGYDGLLPAGAVLTGGSSNLPGIREAANRVLQLPVRIAHPERVTGLADAVRSPAYSTMVGLLRVGIQLDEEEGRSNKRRMDNGAKGSGLGRALGGLVRRFLPERE